MSSSSSKDLANLPPNIRKVGYLKKIKTLKKKWFVLRAETETSPARLEYYDSEKKWRNGSGPKRSIVLKTCFNINRGKVDARHHHAIVLYTRDDCFAVAAENEAEQSQWLSALLELQGSPDDRQPRRPNFDHIWQVTIKNKGLGVSKGLVGPHRLCLTSTCLNLVKLGAAADDHREVLEFPLMTVRRCGHAEAFFYMELGRSTVTGAGELWMETEDMVIAQNMHEAILNAMKTSRANEEFRPRSSSTSDKIIVSRRPVGIVQPQPWNSMASDSPIGSLPSRAYTIPGSRVRATSEGMPLHSSPPTYNPHSSVGSTDSVGSCLSEDDLSLDFHHGNELPTEPTIREEPSDTAAATAASSLPICADSNSMRPYLNLQELSAPLPNASEYIEMASPSQPPSTSSGGGGDYLSMVPESPSPCQPPEEEEGGSGYIPMAPVGQTITTCAQSQQEEEYLNMTPLSSSLPKSTASSSFSYMDMTSPQHSVTSSLASSFTQEEFHLDKVKSYFSPSEDDSDDYIKPIRTYSMGSHPQQMRKSSHLTPTSAHVDSIRTRAYSVGSQMSRKRSAFHHPTIDQELGSLKTIDAKASHKSSSAPLLPPSQTSSRRTVDQRSGDLMEIDYNCPEHYLSMDAHRTHDAIRARKISMGGNQPPDLSSDYVDMSGDKSRLSKANRISSIPDKLSSIPDKFSSLTDRLSQVSDKLSLFPERKSQQQKPAALPAKQTSLPSKLASLPDKPPSFSSISASPQEFLSSSLPNKQAPLPEKHSSSSATSDKQALPNKLSSLTTPNTQTSLVEHKDKSISEPDKTRLSISDKGEYVNLDIKKVLPQEPNNRIKASPDYINLHLGNSTTNTAITTSGDYMSMAPLLSHKQQQLPFPLSPPSRPAPEINMRRDSNSSVASHNSAPPGEEPEAQSPSSDSRPSSISSERELHYASLDLAPLGEEPPRSPRQAIESSTSTTPLVYAEIDFAKSEGGLRLSD